MICQRRGKDFGVGVFAFLALFVGIALNLFSSGDAFAGGKYYQKYDQCIADSGRGHINTVVERCRVANNDNTNNQCALWIGPSDNSSTTTITANISGNQSSVPFRYWGMCTDDPAGTSSIQVIGSGSDAFSIPDSSTQGQHNRWRGNWGNPGYLDGSIDVNKFKNGAIVTDLGGGNYSYTRTVTVKRCNDQNTGSCGNEDVVVILQTGGNTPGPSDSSCPGISVPSGYTASGAKQGWSSVRTQVQKNGGGFSTEVFVKPGDTVNWRHCYFPGVQKAANTSVTTSHNHPVNISGANDTIHPYTNKPLSNATGWGNSYTVKNRYGNDSALSFGTGSSEIRRVDNSYTVDPNWVGSSPSETSSLSSSPWSVSVGSAHNCTWDCAYQKDSTCSENRNVSKHCETVKPINGYSGGQPIYGTPYTVFSECNTSVPINAPNGCNCAKKETVQVPCKVDEWTTCSHNGSVIVDYSTCSNNANCMKSGDKSSETAWVRVPYNYTLNSNVKIQTSVVYAGETASLTDTKIWASEKPNGATGGTYRTKVPVVRGQFVTFVARNANGTDRVTGEFPGSTKEKNGGFTDSEGAWSLSNTNVNVPDMAAGLYFCVALKVYPSNSGTDTNYSDAEGNHSWGTSGVDCKIIAKRPSFQVWGGNVFSNGQINTSTAIKNNGNGLGYVVDGPNATGKVKIYGSWGELGVTALGTNTGFASGNSLSDNGREYNYNKRLQAFCNIESILSFANFMGSSNKICNGTTIYQKNGMFGTGKRNVNKQAIISDLVTDNNTTDCGGGLNISGNHFNISNSYAAVYNRVTSSNNVINSVYCNNNISISESSVGFGQTADASSVVRNVGTTWIIRSDGNINIDGHITYDAGAGYTSFNNMQKLIIYSKKNINIACEVRFVDAILIAEGEVNDCYNATASDDDWKRNSQLRINGAIIADSIKLGRNWGNSGGTYPAQPAEIINHDTTLLLWGRAEADVSESSKTYATYTRELAPRF